MAEKMMTPELEKKVDKVLDALVSRKITANVAVSRLVDVGVTQEMAWHYVRSLDTIDDVVPDSFPA